MAHLELKYWYKNIETYYVYKFMIKQRMFLKSLEKAMFEFREGGL